MFDGALPLRPGLLCLDLLLLPLPPLSSRLVLWLGVLAMVPRIFPFPGTPDFVEYLDRRFGMAGSRGFCLQND